MKEREGLLFLIGLFSLPVILLIVIYLLNPAVFSVPLGPQGLSARIERQMHSEEESGIGVTFTGKVGVEIAPGLVMPFGGTGIEMGF